jgi:geranylgeranyl pyrophosphate synthase
MHFLDLGRMDKILQELALYVPQEKKQREFLQQQAHTYVDKNQLRAPMDFTALEKHSIDLLNQLGETENLKGLLMVLLGNAIWKAIFMGIPYHRRLLLLPQCLRSQKYCKGEFDAYGLLCANCGECPLGQLQQKANDLGYITLIAEGTTTALQLIEEGSIGAVLGVSCMSVLQRSYPTVYQEAIPAIGLPLLVDGCENTQIDTQWLEEYLPLYSQENKQYAQSLFDIKNQVSSFFSPEGLNEHFPNHTPLEKVAIEAILQGGQRMRPILAVLAYRAMVPEKNIDNENILALIIECFHKASLVHDDIQDEDTHRYQTATVHAKYGEAYAINVGDYLMGLGYSLIHRLECPDRTKVDILQLISSAHLGLSSGQAADLSLFKNISDYSVNGLLDIFKEKTGQALKAALLMGAKLANMPVQDQLVLEQLAIELGLSYQIRDDIQEYKEAKEPMDYRKFPLLVVLLLEHDKTFLNENLQIGNSGFDRNIFNKGIENNAIVNKAERLLNQHISECYVLLHQIENTALRLGMFAIINKIFQ